VARRACPVPDLMAQTGEKDTAGPSAERRVSEHQERSQRDAAPQE